MFLKNIKSIFTKSEEQIYESKILPGVAADGMTEGIPRPAARLDPGPPPPPGNGTLGRPSSGGGGPSIVIDTIFCPRNNTKPSTRFSSLGSAGIVGTLALLFSLRNSSQSAKIKFICLSKAM